MSWILAHSGTPIDLIMPSGAMIKPTDIAHALAHLCRFNGHTAYHYSVAQHSVLVCDLVASPEHKLQALLHDAAEAYVGDMVRPLKQLMPQYQVIEQRIWLAICDHFGIEPELAPEVKHADMVALATERRDLMPHHPAEWECLAGITPTPIHISHLSIEEARLNYFHRLMDLIQIEHRRACA